MGRSEHVPSPSGPSGNRRLTKRTTAMLCCIAVLAAAMLLVSGGHLHLQLRRVNLSRPTNFRSASPIGRRPADTDALLLAVASACAKGEDTFISISPPICSSGSHSACHLSSHDPPTRTLKVTRNATDCHPLEIQLGPGERGFGMCSDAAFYVVHLGGRIVPFSDNMFPDYEAVCTPLVSPARLHLESLYPPALNNSAVTNIMLVNSEHMFTNQKDMHMRINTFLCKTHICTRLVRQYINETQSSATVQFMGHSSPDPLWDPPQLRSASVSGGNSSQSTPAVRQDFNRFIHVRGKSGLKHTYQVLECWWQHPKLPILTVVASGHFLYEYARYALLPNVEFVPPLQFPPHGLLALQNAHKAYPQYRGLDEATLNHQVLNLTKEDLKLQQKQTVDGDALQRLQREAGIHVCPSEREGFGHYINEGRAAGALVLSMDHPPMNELVTPDIGVLVKPNRTGSFPEWQALGRYSDINAFVHVGEVCQGVKEVMKLTPKARARMGRRGRAAFLRDRCEFEGRLEALRGKLTAGLASGEAAGSYQKLGCLCEPAGECRLCDGTGGWKLGACRGCDCEASP